MLTDLSRINTSHITGLSEKYREKLAMKLISESIMSLHHRFTHTIKEA